MQSPTFERLLSVEWELWGEVVGQAEGKPNNQKILRDDQDILSRQQWLVGGQGTDGSVSESEWQQQVGKDEAQSRMTPGFCPNKWVNRAAPPRGKEILTGGDTGF